MVKQTDADEEEFETIKINWDGDARQKFRGRKVEARVSDGGPNGEETARTLDRFKTVVAVETWEEAEALEDMLSMMTECDYTWTTEGHRKAYRRVLGELRDAMDDREVEEEDTGVEEMPHEWTGQARCPDCGGFMSRDIDGMGFPAAQCSADDCHGFMDVDDLIAYDVVEILRDDSDEDDEEPVEVPEIDASRVLNEDEQRRAVYLRGIKGMPADVVGDEVGCAHMTVRSVVDSYEKINSESGGVLEESILDEFGEPEDEDEITLDEAIDRARNDKLRERLTDIRGALNQAPDHFDAEVLWNFTVADLVQIRIESSEHWWNEGELGTDKFTIQLGSRGGLERATYRDAYSGFETDYTQGDKGVRFAWNRTVERIADAG